MCIVSEEAEEREGSKQKPPKLSLAKINQQNTALAFFC